jgi:DNA-binding XRE family transcriptional regulator
MSIKKNTRKKISSSGAETVHALPFLERLSGGRLTLAQMLMSIRKGEGLSQASFGKRLGISRAHLCDIEKGRKSLSLVRAIDFAEKLGYSKEQFVTLAIQEMLWAAGLSMKVKLRAA